MTSCRDTSVNLVRVNTAYKQLAMFIQALHLNKHADFLNRFNYDPIILRHSRYLNDERLYLRPCR